MQAAAALTGRDRSFCPSSLSPSVGRNSSSGGRAHARRRQNACRNRCRYRRRRMQSSSMLRRQTQSKVGDAGTAAAAQAQVQQIEAQSGNSQTRPRPNLAKPFPARQNGQEKIITNWAGNPPKNKTKLTQLPQSSTKKNPHGTERELASLQLFLLLKMQFQDRQAGGWNMRPPFVDAAALHWMEY